ncbi:MAG: D-tyrosyl-tRNA(Tyr) deacylase [Actinobacteria bacterium]|nr:D-tyrosyl-tRNA(Tyr) deacylase [Actinomycetota bacterium]MSZ92718.1 D-tyrosyl-tRNA(Tyr) deacylase [Actinomycetota bacterium]
MRAVIQRVERASVTVAGELVGEIGEGLLALVGVTHTDTADDARKLAAKIAGLRVFEDPDGRMGISVDEVGSGRAVLVVSQFTLYGDTSRGRRPGWSAAAPGDVAEPLIDEVVAELRRRDVEVATGRFGADMAVALVNDGPVTLIVEV